MVIMSSSENYVDLKKLLWKKFQDSEIKKNFSHLFPLLSKVLEFGK